MKPRILGIGDEAPLAPPRRDPLGDRLLYGFGILVLLYFVGQGIRFLVQHGLFG